MKSLIISLSLICLSVSLFSQSGVYLSLEAGAAVPMGSFSSDAYAKAGWDGMAGIGYAITDQLGAGLKLGFLHHPTDAPSEVFPGQSPWKSTAVLGVIRASKPINSNLIADAELGAGILSTQFPEANLVINGSPVARVSGSGNGLGYYLSLGMRYQLAEDFAFRLGLGYLGGTPSATQNELTFSRTIGTLTANWGILFEL
ncbi:MAG: outer membrane beta-barrel protein [Bacteroidota bacterium]